MLLARAPSSSFVKLAVSSGAPLAAPCFYLSPLTTLKHIAFAFLYKIPLSGSFASLQDNLHRNVHASVKDTTAPFFSNYAALVASYVTKAALNNK